MCTVFMQVCMVYTQARIKVGGVLWELQHRAHILKDLQFMRKIMCMLLVKSNINATAEIST